MCMPVCCCALGGCVLAGGGKEITVGITIVVNEFCI